MKTFGEVIDRWRSASELAREMGEQGVTVRQWRNRNNIPSEKWQRLIEVAASRGLHDVTLELLASLAASKPRREPERAA
jgi:hypothetical protein